ncbi:hypothetical protein CDHC03_1996 [Corynebacterium diphtheriae HC03]|nr:hypothetical protein CDHC03_1996 [Corynebacterium diphtheriae HC03]AEX82016.1 hypothetical protein CDHC04_2027 [Corynebacterium diphtheriae HC04]AEX84185.1 hypothetical protein CDVA01_1921 [Corynebacterium diphtheriae VA01]
MVIFDPLSQEQLTHIVEIQIAQLARRLAVASFNPAGYWRSVG